MKKYYLHNGTDHQGPFDLEELKLQGINKKTLVWYDGLTEWVTAGELDELKEVITSIAPPPVTNKQFTPPAETKTPKTDAIFPHLDIQNNKFKSKIAPGAILCLIGYFLPWVNLSIFGSYNGFKAIDLGKDFAGEGVVILYLIPIICGVIIYDQYINKFLKPATLNILLAIPTLILIIFVIILEVSESDSSNGFVEIEPFELLTTGFYVTCLACLWLIANIEKVFIRTLIAATSGQKQLPFYKNFNSPLVFNLAITAIFFVFYIIRAFISLIVDIGDIDIADTLLSLLVFSILGSSLTSLVLLALHQFRKPFLKAKTANLLCFLSMVNPYLIIPGGIWMILTRKSLKVTPELSIDITPTSELITPKQETTQNIKVETPIQKTIDTPAAIELTQPESGQVDDTNEYKRPYNIKKTLLIAIPSVLIATVIILYLTNVINFNKNSSKRNIVMQTNIANPDICIYRASSVLTNKKGANYAITNLYDNNPKTAWAEGAKGNGINQFIELQFPMYKISKYQQVELAGLQVINGYCKNGEIFNQNGSVKNLNIYLNDKVVKMVTLSNQFSKTQTIAIQPPVPLKASDVIKLSIQSVYKGTNYEDACISELKPVFNLTEVAE